MPSTSANFDGISATGWIPPDPSGAAGPSQYVELSNDELAVYSKTGGTLIAPERTNTLWHGFGGGCEKNNDGDATVLFDTINQRWVIQQFSVSTTPYLDCVAVSSSSDATGTWYRYSFQYSQFPDYPKMGVWPDAYYASFNLFSLSPEKFEGAEVCAFNRAAMLTGAAATQQCFVQSPSGGSSLLPATLDSSTPPPSGEPEWFVALSPTTANSLAYWQFHVDWSNPANTTFTGPTNLPVEAFSQACGGGVCIPQAETSQRLDSLGDRLMFRLAYRNFGSHEAMVVTHAVTSDNSVGMRWYELRPSGGSLAVYQQGTYAPDSASRWMGSIAMDRVGDMALGYSVSSSSLHPQIRYTGRFAGDPLGTMPLGEATLYEGAGSQTVSERWGDYTEMSVDPVEGCTFWYVNEYHPSNGSSNWHTRIGSFAICGAPSVTIESATDIAVGKATLHGKVNPNGLSTHYHFEWGTQAEYEKGEYNYRAPAVNDIIIGSGSNYVPVEQTIEGLNIQSTYHFRLVAGNGGGKTTSEDKSFTSPSAAITKPPSEVDNEHATLNGSVNPLGVETTYHFEYDTTEYNKGEGPHGTSVPSIPKSIGSGNEYVTVSEPLEGLKPKTTYHFRVVASNAETTIYGEDETFTTLGEWSLQPTPNPQEKSALNDVSCPTNTTNCYAVGYDEYRSRALFERWNGSSWSMLEEVAGRKPTAVSCSGGTFCQAVGEKSDGSPYTVLLAGGFPASEKTPETPAGGSLVKLKGVACSLSAGSPCTTVGTYSKEGKTKPLIERHGESIESPWSLQASATSASEAELKDVSCPSASACYAVGSEGSAATPKPLVESWNGSSWSVQTAPLPPGKTYASLSHISCTSTSACVATGTVSASEGGAPFALRWDGKEWSLTSTGLASSVSDVACASATFCIAAGSKESKTFMQAWDGSKWTAQPSPNPEGKTPFLAAISCHSVTSCAAVGYASFGSGEKVTLEEGYK